MEPLTLAIPTGRLFEDAAGLLRRATGLVEIPLERSLVVDVSDGLRLLVAKPADILTYVELGTADAGIVGKDLLLEQSRDVSELLDLGFGTCRGVLAVPQGAEDDLWRRGRLLRIATKYPRVTARFFGEQGRPVEIIELHGSVELAPRVGLADGIVDLVMTGQTLRDNLLVEVAEVFCSTARFVANRVRLRLRAAGIRDLVARFQTAAGVGAR